jgi:hypothetical protein
MEAESRGFLNTQNKIYRMKKNGRRAGNGAYERKGPVDPKLVLEQMTTPVPKIIDG